MTQPHPILEQQREPGTEPVTWHLNLRWSLADVERVAAMARARNSALHIATVMGCRSAEILELCRRNGIMLGRL